MQRFFILIVFLLGLAACAGNPAPEPTGELPPTPAATYTVTFAATGRAVGEGGCRLAPVVAPTKPAVVPPTTQLDTTTGLHMTGTPQEIDLASYRLKVSGKVEHPLSLSYDDLRCMPKVSREAVLECVGVFRDVAIWAGTPIKYVLEQAGIQAGAAQVRMLGADGYQAAIKVEDALNVENFLAYEFKGQPVPVLHGFPLRVVFPNKTGNFWVKWLTELIVE